MLRILEEKNVRMIFSKDGNEVWFSSRDIAEELGIIQINSILRNIDTEYKKKFKEKDISKVHEKHNSKLYNRSFKESLYNTGEVFISEEAVYNLSFRSNKPEAKLFTKWVSKVLKELRISGRYIATEKDDQWLSIRAEGKKVRKEFTDEIQQFVYYATQKGSNKPNMYYKHFTDLVRKKLDIPKGVERDELDQGTLFDIQALERVISMKLPKLIDKDMHYKDAYKEIKKLIEII
ncbi:MAG: BRO-N domain-containing protein [Paraclostridium sp.]